MVTPLGQYFITDGRYIEQSKEQVKGFERFIDMDTHLNIISKNDLLDSNLKIGFQPSSWKINAESIPYLKSWPGRSLTKSMRDE